VVDTWLKRGENRQTICFGINIVHSEAIADEFRANGVNAVHIDGYTPRDERKEIIADFKAGKIKLLSSVGVLTKGFDAPDATCLVIARPTKSLMLHIQMLGRVLRKSSCDTNALILDHSGNLARLGFPDDVLPNVLDSGKKINRSEKAEQEKEREERAPKPCRY
jgi:superfamily II DNA or RNA helicase